MNKIAFIVQGSRTIGYGHIYRCMRIAELLKKKYNIFFFSYNHSALKIIKINNFNAFLINNIDNIKNFDCVIIDKLDNTNNFLKKISQFNNNLISIDDRNLFKLYNLKKINFLYFPKTYNKQKIINNLKYHIPFDKMPINKFNKKIKKISIIQGGSDPHKNLSRIYQSIKQKISIEKKITFHFHLGIRKNSDKILKYFLGKKKTHSNLQVSYNLLDISKVINNCDLAITACGISALDLIYSNVPSIYVSNENKELHTAKIFDKLNLGIYYGKITIKNQNMLRYNLNNLLKNCTTRLEIYKSMKKLSFKNPKYNLLKLIK